MYTLKVLRDRSHITTLLDNYVHYLPEWKAAILQTRKLIMIRFIVLGGHNVVISPGIPPDSTQHVTTRSRSFYTTQFEVKFSSTNHKPTFYQSLPHKRHDLDLWSYTHSNVHFGGNLILAEERSGTAREPRLSKTE